MPPLFPLTLALYAVAGTLYLAYLLSPGDGRPRMGRAARVALAVAFAAQAVDIGWLCAHGQHPVVNAREAVFFVSWLMCGTYLVMSFRFDIPIIGALVVPTSLVLDVAARFTPSAEARHNNTLLASVHVTMATAGVSLFAVAAGGAVVYLLSERRLKTHRAAGLFGRGPALETLDRLSRRCITLGFPLFTIAMVTGAIWLARLPGEGLFTPQWAMATVTWLLYAALLLLRTTAGWRGRKAALVTLAGFATAMAVLLIYLLRGVTGA